MSLSRRFDAVLGRHVGAPFRWRRGRSLTYSGCLRRRHDRAEHPPLAIVRPTSGDTHVVPAATAVGRADAVWVGTAAAPSPARGAPPSASAPRGRDPAAGLCAAAGL